MDPGARFWKGTFAFGRARKSRRAGHMVGGRKYGEEPNPEERGGMSPSEADRTKGTACQFVENHRGRDFPLKEGKEGDNRLRSQYLKM